jgi:hypothetical protein
MGIDLNAADRQDVTLLPSGVYRLKIKLKFNADGEVLRWAKSMRTQHLEAEYIVVDGAFAGQKLTDYITLVFDDGEHAHLPVLGVEDIRKYEMAVRFGQRRLRAIVESAHGIDPSDSSEDARRVRKIDDLRTLNGLMFYAQVETRKGNGNFRDRNVVDFIVTPDLPDYPKSNGPAQPAPSRSLSTELDDEIPFN